MAEYYPSCKVRLCVRFDEFEKADNLHKISPKVPSTLAKGTNDPRSDLVAEQVTTETGSFWRVVSSRKSSSGKPSAQQNSSDKLTHVLGGIIPKQAQVTINGVPHASTANVTIRYADLPVDPRTIRTCAVDIYMGTVSSDDFAAGIGGKTRTVDYAAGLPFAVTGNSSGVERVNLIPDAWVDRSGRQRTNLRFEGWVDKWEIEAGNDNMPELKLECRDNTALMIDQTAPPKATISAKLPLDRAIAEYLSQFPLCEGLEVEYRPSREAAPSLDKVLAKTAFRPKLGPTPTGGEKMSVWDYITDVTAAIGHSLRVEGSTVVIQRIRNLYGSSTSEGGGRFDDPYQTRMLGNYQMPIRHFIFGRNIRSLRVNRTFKSTPTNVELRCYSAKDKTTIVERYPVKADKPSKHPGPGDKAEQKWVVRRVEGITDKKTLRVIAQSFFECQGRDELGVTVETNDLASFGGDNLDPDILDMAVGDPFRIVVDAKSTANYSSVCSLEVLLLNSKKAEHFLAVTKGFSAEFAKAYVSAYNNRNLVTDFLCRTLQLDWAADSGMKLNLQGVNYVAIRQPSLPVGEEQKGAVKTRK